MVPLITLRPLVPLTDAQLVRALIAGVMILDLLAVASGVRLSPLTVMFSALVVFADLAANYAAPTVESLVRLVRGR